MKPGIAAALTAAALFGASTPLAKILLGTMSPAMLAGLLYLGSGIGLGAWHLLQRQQRRADGTNTGSHRFSVAEWQRLAGAIAAGGIVGPLLLMVGLTTTPAATASLLLNLEAALTLLVAWWIFHEHVDRQVAIGMGCIVAGGCVLSLEGGTAGVTVGALAIVAACLCWAVDNNLTRTIAAGDAVQIAAMKGLVAGSVNLCLALLLMPDATMPALTLSLAAAIVGLAGYGVSLVLFVVALRHLGAARTGGYFSLAPFVGAALSLALFDEDAGWQFWVAGALMGVGLWLHLSERHAHHHVHEPMTHSHPHVHDEHHRHTHDDGLDSSEPHTHMHHHEPMAHSHPHYPDIHHRHRH